MLPRIVPFADAQMSGSCCSGALKAQGLEFRLETKVTAAKVDGERRDRDAGADAKGEARTSRATRCWSAVGRQPCTDGSASSRPGVALEPSAAA